MPTAPRAAAAAALAALCPHRAAGHGVLNKPLSRNGLACNTAACQQPPVGRGIPNGGKGTWNIASWFSNNVHFAGNATLESQRDHALLTQCTGGGVPPAYVDCDWTLQKGSPWRAPGTATLLSPCGNYHGGAGAADGAALAAVPPANRSTWTAGGVAEVAWGISANHGGGYSYRLCPASEPLTEACFQRTPLRFADSTTDLVGIDGAVLHTIPAVRTTEGTSPAGSEWTRNPIPSSPSMFPAPAPGMSGSPQTINVLDRVRVPAGLAPGDYVLGWRWDCEQTVEVWNNCADIRVTAAAQ